jgi:hypothetical protein
MESTDKNSWSAAGSTGTFVQDDSPGSARDLKSYLSSLAKNRLILLASKYKVRICKTRRKRQIVDSFLCRVPSDMIEPICSELEREERQRRTPSPAAGNRRPMHLID